MKREKDDMYFDFGISKPKVHSLLKHLPPELRAKIEKHVREEYKLRSGGVILSDFGIGEIIFGVYDLLMYALGIGGAEAIGGFGVVYAAATVITYGALTGVLYGASALLTPGGVSEVAPLVRGKSLTHTGTIVDYFNPEEDLK